MILYGSSLSPYVRKVLAYAGEKGIELDLQPTGFPNPSPGFLDTSPFRKMPALRDGSPETSSTNSSQRAIGYAIGGAGVVGVAIGTAFLLKRGSEAM